MRHLTTAAKLVGAGLLIAIGVPLVLYAAVIALRAAPPQEKQWYETVALIPLIPGVFSLAGASWLIRNVRRG